MPEKAKTRNETCSPNREASAGARARTLHTNLAGLAFFPQPATTDHSVRWPARRFPMAHDDSGTRPFFHIIGELDPSEGMFTLKLGVGSPTRAKEEGLLNLTVFGILCPWMQVNQLME